MAIMKLKISQKIKDTNSLILEIKNKNPDITIGLCHGVFDVLHSGHIRHFAEASNLVDVLVVSVTSDNYVDKGPGRPVNTIQDRMNILASIEFIDYIVESKASSAVSIIESVKPAYYFKGKDYAPDPSEISLDMAGNLDIEEEATVKSGGLVYYTTSQLNSSSTLINSLTIDTNKTRDIVEHVKGYLNSKPIEKILTELKDKNITIIGEVIYDEFVYTESLGKSGKHPIVAEREVYRKNVLGGICPLVSTFETFVASKNLGVISVTSSITRPSTSSAFDNLIVVEDYTPIVKTRYVNQKTNTFMYEIYEMEDKLISGIHEEAIIQSLKSASKNSDLLVALDFGHGLITPNARKFMSGSFKNFALNVQKNAGNKGFSTIGKYSSASLIVMNGEEVELEFKQKGMDLVEAAKIIHKNMKARIVVITDGANGLVITNGDSTYKIPSFFSGNIADRTGAGDSVFAVLSLFSLVIEDLIVLGYLGNLAGAMNLNWVANENIISSQNLVKAIYYGLK